MRLHAEPVRRAALALKAEAAALRFRLAAMRLGHLLAKANFNPLQPRVPRGHPDGGEGTRVGGVFGEGMPAAGIDEAVSVILVADERGTLEGPPEIPKRRPSDSVVRNRVIRNTASWAKVLKRAAGPVALFLDSIDETWMRNDLNEIDAYLDDPKTLEELQRDVAFPKKGYHIHHIVEQGPARQDKLDPKLIDGPDNLVRIPTLIHREITNWYARGNVDFGGKSPRDYLRGKTWDERYALGINKLVDFGALKP